jgi:hypothetical protein
MGCGCRESKPAPPPEVKHAVKVQATPVNSVLHTKASKELEQQVAKELEVEDPSDEVVQATLNPVVDRNNGGGLGEFNDTIT